MTNKDFYTSPEVDVFTVCTEGVVCQSPGAWDESIIPGTTWGGNGTGFGLE